MVLGLELAQRAQGRQLRHAPGVDHLHAVVVLERADHGRRAGRAADHGALEAAEVQVVLLHVVEQAQPHGGHAGAEGDLLGLEQLVERLAVEVRAGHHQLGAAQGGRIRDAPGIDVEHRHDGQDHVLRRQRHGIRQGGGVGMQDGGAMAVDRALGMPGRAGGVADAGGGVLVELGPGVVPVLGLDQFLVAQQAWQRRRCRHVGAVRHQHEVPHRGKQLRDLLHQRQEAEVEAQHLVFRVVDDPGDLVGEEPRVDGVAHQLRARGAVVDLEVPVAVPGQRADPVAGLAAEPGQRLRQLAGAQLCIGVGVAVDVALDPLGDDLGVAAVARRMRQQRRDHQGHLHHLAHQAWHGGLLRMKCCRGGCRRS